MSAPSELATALQAALTLSPADQAFLCALLQRVTDAHADDDDPVGDTELATRAVEDPQVEVHAWLQRIALQSAWLRLQLVEEALHSCDTDVEREALAAAHSQLLQAHPPLVVRRSVAELATVHPASTGIAVVGLLLGAVGLARIVLHIVF